MIRKVLIGFLVAIVLCLVMMVWSVVHVKIKQRQLDVEYPAQVW